MERFVIIVNGFQPLTIITKRSILVVAAVLDSPLTMGDYYNLYLKADVLLLADVFEKFINTRLEYYGLNPCQYFSSPGLSWDAMLKMTGIELELISDIDMHLFY